MRAVGRAASVAILAGAVRAEAALDLSGWQVEGYDQPASWQVDAAGTSVLVTDNQDSSLLAGGVEAQDTAISLTIRVETDLDDDFFGFALGFDPGDTENFDADFVYLDWKKATGVSAVGMAVSRVQGVPGDLIEFGVHSGQHVTELARAATLSDVGWVEGVDYHFEVEFTATRLEIWVDGGLEFAIDGAFSPGGFALYNRSQPQVRYRDVEIVPLAPAVPVPALPAGLLAALALALVALVLQRAQWGKRTDRETPCDAR